jgi:HEAT repeat protein
MKLLLIRSATLLSTALLILTFLPCPPLSGFQIAHAQDDARQIPELETVLRISSGEEKRRAVMQLSEITSEKATELLRRTLKNNLANKRGYYVQYGSATSVNSIEWTYVPSENDLLVRALGNRKDTKALPTLRKMLKMKEKGLGLSIELVAATIYLISPQPVRYTVDGESKIYPEPELKTDGAAIIGSLRSPSSGEAAWEENSLNARIRELVRVLGSSGGPVGFRDPYNRTLKEDIGLSTLMSLVESGDPMVRPYVVEALGILGENLNEIIPVLTAAVRDKDPRVRFRSVRGLGHLLGSNIKPEEVTIIISALKTALSDPEAEVRFTAAEELGEYATGHYGSMNERMKDVVSLLVSALDDRVGDVRSGAAYALGRIGPLTERVVPSLIRLLNSPEPGDREKAAQALGDISTCSFGQSEERERMKKEIGRALLKAADDPAKSVRYEVAEGLGEIGPVVRGVVPALIKLTKDPSRGVRTAAARSLGEFEIERTRIVSALARMLKVQDEDAEVIESALRSLGEIGREARSAAPEVRRLLKSENPRIREYAGYALEKIEFIPAPGGEAMQNEGCNELIFIEVPSCC